MEKTELENRTEDRVIDGELVAVETASPAFDDDEPTRVSARAAEPKILGPKPENLNRNPLPENRKPKTENRTPGVLQYLFLPFLFLTVALLGGLRLSSENNAFIFWRPALFCLIAAAILLVLFARAGLIRLEGWFSERFSPLENAANAAVLVSLFAASTQIFNALLPEQGLPFWVFAFCFFWTLWNNLFADFETKKLLRSLGALFGLAFVVKYLILANFAAPAGESFWQSLWQNPGKEAVTWLLDLPRFAAGTGYIQFFTVVFYLLGLYLLPSSPRKEVEINRADGMERDG